MQGVRKRSEMERSSAGPRLPRMCVMRGMLEVARYWLRARESVGRTWQCGDVHEVCDRKGSGVARYISIGA